MYRSESEPLAWHPRWLYGDAWERWPIRPGETWRIGPHVVRCHDIEATDPPQRVDVVYTDPPWGPGNARWWRTKAGAARPVSWPAFCGALARHLAAGTRAVYVEISERWIDALLPALEAAWPAVQVWPITYYANRPSCLVRAGLAPVALDFAGLDDAFTPFAAMIAERPSSVYDPCSGLGTTALAAVTAGATFVGGELHPRRAAVVVDRLARLTGLVPKRDG